MEFFTATGKLKFFFDNYRCSMCVPRVTRHTSIRYSSSCHIRVNKVDLGIDQRIIIQVVYRFRDVDWNNAACTGFQRALLNMIKNTVLRKEGNFFTIYLHVESQEKLSHVLGLQPMQRYHDCMLPCRQRDRQIPKTSKKSNTLCRANICARFLLAQWKRLHTNI